ncbi:FUSC family protein [Edwardsiella anguillarum]|nr:FUSC family protein [Edwardsiella anguillarum]
MRHRPRVRRRIGACCSVCASSAELGAKMLHPRVLHLRFACKLTLAIVLSLLLGFYFGLQTPRWSALTAALVAAGPAFAAGGEPLPAPFATAAGCVSSARCWAPCARCC